MQDQRDAGEEGCRNGGIQDLTGYMKGGIREKEGFRTGGMQETQE